MKTRGAPKKKAWKIALIPIPSPSFVESKAFDASSELELGSVTTKAVLGRVSLLFLFFESDVLSIMPK